MGLRRALPILLVLLLPAFAGCNAKDWYNQMGTVQVDLAPQGATNTSLNEFRTIKVAIYGVTVKQYLAADAKQFSFGANPLVIDLVEKGRAGERVTLAEFKVNLRAVESVTVHLDVVEAVDAGGESLQICRLQDTVEKWPCFFMPDNNAFRYDEKSFSPPRGGEAVVAFPLAVKYATQGRKAQYYLDTPADLVEITNKR